jgi:hypothetical protein
METLNLRVPALALAIMLPLTSAVQLGKWRGGYILRYVRCLFAYFFVWVFLACGYVFQTMISPTNPEPWPVYSSFSTFDWIIFSARNEYQNIEDLSARVLAASIVTFCLLMGQDTRSRSVNTLLAAFVTLVVLDLFTGMIGGYNVSQYLYNVVLDFTGALYWGWLRLSLSEWLYHCRRELKRNQFLPSPAAMSNRYASSWINSIEIL